MRLSVPAGKEGGVAGLLVGDAHTLMQGLPCNPSTGLSVMRFATLHLLCQVPQLPGRLLNKTVTAAKKA